MSGGPSTSTCVAAARLETRVFVSEAEIADERDGVAASRPTLRRIESAFLENVLVFFKRARAMDGQGEVGDRVVVELALSRPDRVERRAGNPGT